MKVRKHYLISGSVQGVGFRYYAKYAAKVLGLTGYARNLYDGRVEMEVQGDADKVDQILGMIDEGRFVHIDGIESEDLPLSAEKGFRVY